MELLHKTMKDLVPSLEMNRSSVVRSTSLANMMGFASELVMIVAIVGAMAALATKAAA